jgi:hypothetical protein
MGRGKQQNRKRRKTRENRPHPAALAYGNPEKKGLLFFIFHHDSFGQQTAATDRRGHQKSAKPKARPHLGDQIATEIFQ